MKKSLLFIGLVYLLPAAVLIPVIQLLFRNDYPEFTFRIASMLQKPEWEVFIQNRFSASSFYTARWIVALLMVLYLMAGYLLYRHHKSIVEKAESTFQYVWSILKSKRNEFLEMPAYARWTFLVLLAGVALKAFWYILVWPVQYDEAWTYNYFIGNSFWQSFLMPYNNHTFFTVTAWFFHWLPLDPQISMRLPNFFGGLLLVIVFFFFIKRHISLPAALLATAWLATSCPVVFYMLYARGYLFVMLFTVIALWLQVLFIRNNRKKFFGAILFLSLALGYWSNPVFIYPHTAIGLTGIWLLLQKKYPSAFWKNFLVHVLAVIFVLILYLPILLTGHLQDILNAGTREVFTLHILWKSVEYNSWFVFGFREGYYVLFVLAFLFVLSIMKYRQLPVLPVFVIASYLVILLFSVVQSQPIAGRMAIFFSVAVTIQLALILHHTQKKLTAVRPLFILLVTAIAAFNSIVAHRHHWLNWSVPYDKSAKKIAGILEENDISTCYLTINYYKPHLEYFYKIKGKKLRLSLKDTASQDFRPLVPSEQEAVIMRYSEMPILPAGVFRQLYQDETAVVFVRKDLAERKQTNRPQ